MIVFILNFNFKKKKRSSNQTLGCTIIKIVYSIVNISQGKMKIRSLLCFLLRWFDNNSTSFDWGTQRPPRDHILFAVVVDNFYGI